MHKGHYFTLTLLDLHLSTNETKTEEAELVELTKWLNDCGALTKTCKSYRRNPITTEIKIKISECNKNIYGPVNWSLFPYTI